MANEKRLIELTGQRFGKLVVIFDTKGFQNTLCNSHAHCNLFGLSVDDLNVLFVIDKGTLFGHFCEKHIHGIDNPNVDGCTWGNEKEDGGDEDA